MARSRGFRRAGQKRATDWLGSVVPSAVATAPTVISSLGGISLTEGSVSLNTIVRIRGCFRTQRAAGGSGAQAFGVGCGMFSDREVTLAASGGLPGPLTDADDDRWMWHACGFVEEVTDPTQHEGVGFQRIDIDSKAMRKWEENFQLHFVVENLNISGAAVGIISNLFFRVLVKLS